MRAAAALAAFAALLAGCTSFPGSSRIVAEVEVGDLAPGGTAARNFTLPGGADFLFVGYRTGPADHLHVVLRAPSGERFDTAAGNPPAGCAVKAPAPGPWTLEIAADAFDGFMRGGKFTVRAAQGEVPPILPCADDTFPGRGRNVTLAWWSTTLAQGENTTVSFAQPLALDHLEAVALNATANVTLTLTPPGGAAVPPEQAPRPPPEGPWTLQALVPASEPSGLLNATLLVRGWG